MFSVQTGMKYMEFNLRNPRCIHCYISDRAYASVITEVLSNGKNETGGVFLGYIINRACYIVESVDPGMQTVNQVAFFQWDTDYVNYQADRLGKIYNIPLTILGFWHRHPGSMDYFSATDEKTIGSNLRQLRAGLLSMLVNIDPKLRMTFYYCYGNEIMPIRYDVGNRYFPVELLQYADAKELSRREAKKGRTLDIHYEKVIDLDAIAKKKRSAAAPSPSAGGVEQQAKPKLRSLLKPPGRKKLLKPLKQPNPAKWLRLPKGCRTTASRHSRRNRRKSLQRKNSLWKRSEKEYGERGIVQ